MEAKEIRGLAEAYASIYNKTISESHFKVGDEVVCKASGMEGEVIKLDKPDGAEDEKYYTVKREDGKTMKYAPNELKLAEKEGKEEEEKEDEDEKEEKEDVKEAKNGGASKKAETSFHKKLDSLVHHTFGKREEEKKMKEEVSYSAKKARAGKDIGKPGKMFGKIAKEAGERYGSEERGKKVAGAVLAKLRKEEVDLFDIILEHLVAEGYADTNQAAIAIMANMSEEWKRSILSEDPIIDFRARGMVGSPGPSIPGAKNKYTKPAPPTQSSTASVTKPVVRGREFTNPPS